MKQLFILIISSLVTFNVFAAEKPERIVLTFLKPVHIEKILGHEVQLVVIARPGMNCQLSNFENYPIDIKANSRIVMYKSEFDYRISWITDLSRPNIMGFECAIINHDELTDGYPATFLSMFNSAMKGFYSIVQLPQR